MYKMDKLYTKGWNFELIRVLEEKPGNKDVMNFAKFGRLFRDSLQFCDGTVELK